MAEGQSGEDKGGGREEENYNNVIQIIHTLHAIAVLFCRTFAGVTTSPKRSPRFYFNQPAHASLTPPPLSPCLPTPLLNHPARCYKQNPKALLSYATKPRFLSQTQQAASSKPANKSHINHKSSHVQPSYSSSSATTAPHAPAALEGVESGSSSSSSSDRRPDSQPCHPASRPCPARVTLLQPTPGQQQGCCCGRPSIEQHSPRLPCPSQ